MGWTKAELYKKGTAAEHKSWQSCAKETVQGAAHQTSTPNPQPQTATKSHCLHLAQPAPAQLCNRFGCTSSRLSLPTAASSGESKWITAPVGQPRCRVMSGVFYVQRPCPPFSRGGFRRKYDLLVMPQISFKN